MNALLDQPLLLPDLDHEWNPGDSSCLFSVLDGGGVTLWMPGDPGQETRKDLRLQISPEHPVIIGRAEGGGVPYLDPAYQSTTIIPGTGETILRHNGDGRDNCVSRAHFMLRSIARGILLVNGVPRRGGGIRPPRNGTRLLKPAHRELAPKEELMVESGEAIVLMLPNSTTIRIVAE